MILNVVLGSPLWVWPLLVGLVWYGLRASGTRTTSAIAVYMLPLLGLISINSVLKMSHQETVWVAYAAAYVLGVVAGYQMQRGWLLKKAGLQVTLAGEWFTMTILMVIFWMNFASGVFRALAPDLYGDLTFVIVYAIVVGVASGTFGGRALKVWLTGTQPANQVAA